MKCILGPLRLLLHCKIFMHVTRIDLFYELKSALIIIIVVYFYYFRVKYGPKHILGSFREIHPHMLH